MPFPLVVQVTRWGLVAIYVTIGIAALSHMHLK